MLNYVCECLLCLCKWSQTRLRKRASYIKLNIPRARTHQGWNVKLITRVKCVITCNEHNKGLSTIKGSHYRFMSCKTNTKQALKARWQMHWQTLAVVILYFHHYLHVSTPVLNCLIRGLGASFQLAFPRATGPASEKGCWHGGGPGREWPVRFARPQC